MGYLEPSTAPWRLMGLDDLAGAYSESREDRFMPCRLASDLPHRLASYTPSTAARLCVSFLSHPPFRRSRELVWAAHPRARLAVGCPRSGSRGRRGRAGQRINISCDGSPTPWIVSPLDHSVPGFRFETPELNTMMPIARLQLGFHMALLEFLVLFIRGVSFPLLASRPIALLDPVYCQSCLSKLGRKNSTNSCQVYTGADHSLSPSKPLAISTNSSFESRSSCFSVRQARLHSRINGYTREESMLSSLRLGSARAAGWLADRIGRKRTIQAGSLVAVLGCSLQTGAQNISYLMVGRAIAGISIGCLSMIVPVSSSRCSSRSSGVGYGCQYIDNEAQWRIPLAIQVVPAILLLVGMFFLPFSPRWLVEKGRNEEAFQVIQRLHGNEQNAELIKLEFADMVEQIKHEKVNMSSKLSDLWATKSMLKRTLTGVAVQVCCQLSGTSEPHHSYTKRLNNTLLKPGINVIAYYQPSLYKAIGVGRRLPLIIGAFGMAGCLAIEVHFRYLRLSPIYLLARQAAINAKFPGEASNNTAAQRAGVAFIILFGSLFFSTSFGPVSWVYQSEIFPMRVRAMGTSIATMIGWKFYLVFICTNIVNGKSHGALFIAGFPETKGKTLEEMDAVFGDQAIGHALETGRTHNVSGLDDKDGSLEKIEKV
ncbi:sugar (and other) transporter domain-containing protein [Rhizoctonia solani AG-1 IA]|uniref:Sugar (And other) transporter domain-containing protein n=1 Tax=Thanatephorus cucumeris (strain AG1-IA) TaxID=983506 RepID=L8XA10_THACA|nr:sugar (and other) transporter domain-containing protein [Rhizoctonia solani AG-1 IA]